MAAAHPQIEFYRDEGGEHRWRIRGVNGGIVGASSEGFDTLATAEANVELLGELIGLFSLQKAHGAIEVEGIE